MADQELEEARERAERLYDEMVEGNNDAWAEYDVLIQQINREEDAWRRDHLVGVVTWPKPQRTRL